MKICTRKRRPFGKRRGLSEILGALMLILVVVIAVGTIAYFVSAEQKQEMDRQSHLDSVKNEKIEFVSTEFYPNDPNIEFELSNGTASYFVEHLLDNDTGFNIHDLNAEMACAIVGGNYSGSFGAGVRASLTYPADPCQLTIDPAGTFKLEPATWAIMNFTIRNLNTQDSGIIGFKVNERFLTWQAQVDTQGKTFQTFARGSALPLVLPAQETRKVMVNFSNPDNRGMAPKKTDPLIFAAFASTANFFESTAASASPLLTANTQREDYAVTSRDIIVMDASQSSFSEGSFAKSFIWKLDIPRAGWKSDDWNDVQHLTSKYITGKIVEYRPESILNSTELAKLNFTGPFRVTLKIVDDKGIMSGPISTIIPRDPNIAPLGSISLVYVGATGTGDMTTPITVQVKDIFGRNVANVGVSFSIQGGDHVKQIQTPFAITNSSGMADTNLEWVGRVSSDQAQISAVTGKLPSLYIRLP